jgi:hypothetical protein
MLRKVSLKFVWLFLILGIVVMTSQPVFALWIIVRPTTNGTTNPVPQVQYNCTAGTDVPVKIIPNAGYVVDTVLVDGAASTADKLGKLEYDADGVGATYTFINISGDSHNMTVSFKLVPANKYTVTVAAGPGGTISPEDPQITVYEGQTRNFTITPNEGYVLDDLTLNGASVKENIALDGTYTLSGITADSALNATFKAIPKEFKITATAGPNGTIAPAEITVKEGETTDFTITPDPGYTIDKVTLDDVEVTNSVTSESKYPLPPASKDCEIHVTFKALPPVQHKITASAEENGTIDSLGDVMVDNGTSKTFTITPTGNYQVFDVLADGVSVGAKTSYTFENVTADHTINATFHLPGDADGQDGVTLKDAVKFLQIGAGK